MLCDILAAWVSPSELHCDPRFYEFDFPNLKCDGLLPDVVVRPRSDETIVRLMTLLTNLSVPVRVRSGGHGFECTAFRTGGVHVDLRSMTASRLYQTPDGWRATFQTGNRFKDLGIPSNRFSFVHGECDEVGVGGYYLHGGIHAGSLTRKYGWANESIVNMTVVTTWGERLTLCEGCPHSDLWRGMRLAGSTLAIATELTVRIHETPEPNSFLLYTNLGADDLDIVLELSMLHETFATDVAYSTRGVFLQVTVLKGNFLTVLGEILRIVPFYRLRGLTPLFRGTLYNFRGRLESANTYSFDRPTWKEQMRHTIETFQEIEKLTLPTLSDQVFDLSQATFNRDWGAMVDANTACHCVFWPCPGHEDVCLAMEVDCWTKDYDTTVKVSRLLHALEETYETYPGRRKYYNTPTSNANLSHYFEDLEELSALKRRWDPDDLLPSLV